MPRRVCHLSLAINDAVDKGGDRICSDVTGIRLVLDHVVTQVNVTVCGTLFDLQSKELEDSRVVLFISVDVDKQHLQ